MFSHIMVGANDLSVSKTFYDAILKVLGYPEGAIDIDSGRCFYPSETCALILTLPINGEPATHGNGMTIGFKAENPEQVDAWHAAGLAHGGVTCEDPPGVRSTPERSLYLAYLRDPAGNKLCAAHFMPRNS